MIRPRGGRAMNTAEELRIRAALTGVTGSKLGELLGITTSQAHELLSDRCAVPDSSERKHQARDQLRARAPNLTEVYRALIQDELRPDTAGRDVRWTRLIMGICLRAWSRAIGLSSWWWSEFETKPEHAAAALEAGRLTLEQIFDVESRMLEAGVRLALVVPSCVARLRPVDGDGGDPQQLARALDVDAECKESRAIAG